MRWALIMGIAVVKDVKMRNTKSSYIMTPGPGADHHAPPNLRLLVFASISPISSCIYEASIKYNIACKPHRKIIATIRGTISRRNNRRRVNQNTKS